MSRGFSCMLGALGALCVGCGEDALKDESAAQSDAAQRDDAGAIVSADTGPGARECDGARIASLPEGEPSWSAEQAAACASACPDLDTACLRAECPGHEQHLLCVADAVDACASAIGGPCRAEWTAYVCCGKGACDDPGQDDDELTACIERECGALLGAFSECADALTDEADEGSCFRQAQDRCARAPEGDASQHDLPAS